MELAEKERQVLNVLADERDKNPPGWMDGKVLAARVNSLYDHEAYGIALGLMFHRLIKLDGRLRNYRVLITENGYKLVKPPPEKKQQKCLFLIRIIRELYVATVEGVTRAFRKA